MKIKLMSVYPFEYQALQNYLNEMAEQGYHIKRMGAYYLGFEKAQKNCQYHVVIRKEMNETQQNQLKQAGYEYVCGWKYFEIYRTYGKVKSKLSEGDALAVIADWMKQYSVSDFSALALVLIGIVIMNILPLINDYFYFLELFASRALQLSAAYMILLLFSLYKKEAPVRAFRRDSKLICESEAIQKRGLSIFLIFFLIALCIYQIPSACVILAMYLIVRALTQKNRNVYLGVLALTGVCGGLLISHTQSHPIFQSVPQKHPLSVMNQQCDEYAENESLWLKTQQYSNDTTRILHVELKEGKLQNFLNNQLVQHYRLKDTQIQYCENTYIVCVSDSEYYLIETEASESIEKQLKKLYEVQ